LRYSNNKNATKDEHSTAHLLPPNGAGEQRRSEAETVCRRGLASYGAYSAGGRSPAIICGDEGAVVAFLVKDLLSTVASVDQMIAAVVS